MIDRLSRSQAKMEQHENSYIKQIYMGSSTGKWLHSGDDKHNFMSTSGLDKLTTR